MSRQRSSMYSPGATGQEGHDSQTLRTGIHLPCPRVPVDNSPPGHRIRDVEDFTAEFRQRMRRNSTFTLGEYIYGIILLCGLLIYDQQEQLRRRANHYSARFTPNHMVWQACRFCWSWLHQNNLMLVGIFIGVALIVPTQISPSEYLRHQAGRLLVLVVYGVEYFAPSRWCAHLCRLKKFKNGGGHRPYPFPLGDYTL